MRNMVKDEGGWTKEQIWGLHGVSRWKGIYGGLVSFSKFLRFEKRDGSRVRFWTKIWCGDRSLKDLFLDLFALAVDKEALVSSYLSYERED